MSRNGALQSYENMKKVLLWKPVCSNAYNFVEVVFLIYKFH